MVNNTGYHHEWQLNRVNWMLSLYPTEFWKDKDVLELAPCNGAIGEFFRTISKSVVSVEGRPENISSINQRFPSLKVIQGNLDSPAWEYGKFDIIINFGLFYHLETYQQEHLENCIKNCNLMFFESVIFDSNRPELYETKERFGNDQSLSGIGKTPSSSFIEDIFKQNNVEFKRYDEKCLNAGNHVYDWVEDNKKNYHNSKRRMWVVST